jgi:uncharacterized membrane protein
VDTYLWLKLVHILAAIVAVGSNVTYFVWLRRSGSDPAREAEILRGVRAIDLRLANPAFVVLPITGILMVLDGDLGFTTFWIATAIGLYVALGFIAGAWFGPALRRQAELASAGADPVEYGAAARRTMISGSVTMVPIAAILYLMVMKPGS